MSLLRGGLLPGGNRIGRRLTIIQLLPALHGGGVERGTLEIAQALVEAGHRSIVVSGGGRLVAALQQAGSEHFELAIGRKVPWVFGHAHSLRRLFADTSADIVHARSRLPAWVTWRALRGMARRPRFVTTLHGLNSVSRYSSIMTRGDAVIAVSETARRYWTSHYPGLATRRIEVIHRGVDPGEFPYGYEPPAERAEAWRSRLGWRDGDRLICLPGRIAAGKGHLDLVAAARALPANVRVAVAGSGGARAERRVRDAVARTGLAGRFVFTGHVSEIRDLMALSELVLCLSRKPESFGRTVAEALALGRPVIGYDHGGVGEILAEIYPAGAVPPDDRKTLVARIRAFLDDAPPVPDRQPYLKSAMQAQTLSLYESLAGDAHVPQDPES